MAARHVSRRARYETEKNLSRLAADKCSRISVAIEEMCAQAGHCAEDELTTLEQMLAQTKSDEPRLREAVQELEILLESLRV